LSVPRDDLLRRAAAIRLAVFDCDGVFTDGRLFIGDDGAEYKAFHVHDGHGIRRLLESGIEVAVISGRESAAVRRRMADLGVTHLFERVADKVAVLRELQASLGVDDGATACTGDDLPDRAMLATAGLAIAVANAARELDEVAHWRTDARGGEGAVREVCDLLLAARRTRPQ
jgi:3-deoxy-D-manno-octulosonate 8-phosphate phosphatase (KDO 8-P phosphatase)